LICFTGSPAVYFSRLSKPRSTVKVDFGSGACDTIVNVTIGFKTQEIDLKKWLDDNAQ